MRGIDCRFACLCAFPESSFDLFLSFDPKRLAGLCGLTGLDRTSGVGASVEKDLGLKSRGDGVRLKPFAGRDGTIVLAGGSLLSDEGCGFDDEKADIGRARFIGSSFKEAGEELSGLAIFNPPNDSVRLKSVMLTMVAQQRVTNVLGQTLLPSN